MGFLEVKKLAPADPIQCFLQYTDSQVTGGSIRLPFPAHGTACDSPVNMLGIVFDLHTLVAVPIEHFRE